MRVLGESFALTLHEMGLSDYDRGDLLVKLRVLAGARGEYEKEQADQRAADARARAASGGRR